MAHEQGSKAGLDGGIPMKAGRRGLRMLAAGRVLTGPRAGCGSKGAGNTMDLSGVSGIMTFGADHNPNKSAVIIE